MKKKEIEQGFEAGYDIGYGSALDEVKRNGYEEANKKWLNYINRGKELHSFKVVDKNSLSHMNEY